MAELHIVFPSWPLPPVSTTCPSHKHLRCFNKADLPACRGTQPKRTGLMVQIKYKMYKLLTCYDLLVFSCFSCLLYLLFLKSDGCSRAF